MYGHELPITGLDLLHQEKCITSGEDGTIRLWKIQESTQLKFISKGHAIDCLCYVSTDKWVSGSQQGILQLWYHTNKKPVFEVINAHGLTNVTANWITAIAAVLYSDLIATGSSNGVVKLWKVTKEREIEHIKDIPILGWINALHFTRDGKYLIVGAGQEPKYAKWERKKMVTKMEKMEFILFLYFENLMQIKLFDFVQKYCWFIFLRCIHHQFGFSTRVILQFSVIS